jgi:hypothetical protein
MRMAISRVLAGLALLLLAAHFFRAGLMPLAALLVVLLALLFIRANWATRTVQIVLALGTLEWLRTAWVFAAARAAQGQPYGRLLAILGAVAALTAVASVLLSRRTVRNPGEIR